MTPIYNGAVPEHMRQIGKIIKSVGGPEKLGYDAFITNQCGLHVHVESPKEMKVLIELAIILLVYEEEISQLHPPCRRPGHPASKRQLDSNRLWFLKNDDLVFSDGNPSLERHWLDTDCSTEALSRKYSIQEIRNRMLLIRTKEKLSAKMCAPKSRQYPHGNRNRLVNFVNLARGEGFSETIEFRQARGSLSRTDIFHWTSFCIGLVKAAQFYVENPDRFPAKDWEDIRVEPGTKVRELPIFKLMQNMELHAKAPKFWAKKIVKYARSKPGDENNRTDNEAPPIDDPLLFDIDSNDRNNASTGKFNIGLSLSFRPRPTRGDFSSTSPVDLEPPQGRGAGEKGGPEPVQHTDLTQDLEPTRGPLEESEGILKPLVTNLNLLNNEPSARQLLASLTKVVQRVPAGKYAIEPMAQDEMSWFVEDFKGQDWKRILPRPPRGDPRLRSCGIHAIIDSFRAQYPLCTFADIDPRKLLASFDKIFKGRKLGNASDDQLHTLISTVTIGEFRLVINHSSCSKAFRPRAVGNLGQEATYAKNLYMRLICGDSGDHKRWEGMRRYDASTAPTTPTRDTASDKAKSVQEKLIRRSLMRERLSEALKGRKSYRKSASTVGVQACQQPLQLKP